MSRLHVTHIRNALKRDYEGLIDVSDVSSRAAKDVEMHFLTRALAAYALEVVADAPRSAAAAHVTDGHDDNGIDALWFDRAERKLFVVQSKWDQKGERGPSLADVKKFLSGVEDLLNQKLSAFNDKVRALEDDLWAVLKEPSRVALVYAYTGQQPLSRHAKNAIDGLLAKTNTPTPLLSFTPLSLGELHDAVFKNVLGAPITLNAMLYEWGRVSDPYHAVYGQISAADVAMWHGEYGDRLFAKNLRNLIQDSDVNAQITESVLEAPEAFWYRNNGITAICANLTQAPYGCATREAGVFQCESVSIVNGAQTVGSIALAAKRNPDAVGRARVLLRVISLAGVPDRFALTVTKAANTQNRIESRDFAALDPEQHRLWKEMLLDNREYAYRTGEEPRSREAGCTINEATIALACAEDDVSFAVIAKSAVGRLWNTDKPSYEKLFNRRLTAKKLWATVRVLRAVDDALAPYVDSRERDGRTLIAVHGNRFVAHQVFRRLRMSESRSDEAADGLAAQAREMTAVLLDGVTKAVAAVFENAIVATLFKSAENCRALNEKLAGFDPTPNRSGVLPGLERELLRVVSK